MYYFGMYYVLFDFNFQREQVMQPVIRLTVFQPVVLCLELVGFLLKADGLVRTVPVEAAAQQLDKELDGVPQVEADVGQLALLTEVYGLMRVVLLCQLIAGLDKQSPADEHHLVLCQPCAHHLYAMRLHALLCNQWMTYRTASSGQNTANTAFCHLGCSHSFIVT